MIVASVFYGEISSIGNKEKTLAKAFQELGLSNLELLLKINSEKLDYCHHKLDLLQQPSFNNLHGSFVAIFL
jgi:hypothetical protein